eukprot:7437304-Pyramimonas_sp.AAC.1
MPVGAGRSKHAAQRISHPSAYTLCCLKANTFCLRRSGAPINSASGLPSAQAASSYLVLGGVRPQEAGKEGVGGTYLDRIQIRHEPLHGA